MVDHVPLVEKIMAQVNKHRTSMVDHVPPVEKIMPQLMRKLRMDNINHQSPLLWEGGALLS